MILIVGGAGYIGSHINKELNKQGYETLILDDLSSGRKELVKWGKLIEGNLGDEIILEKLFTENTIEAVMHFGAFKAVGESVTDPEKYYLNNVAATMHLLKIMRKHGVNKFIFSSSAAVFGIPEYTPIDEKHPKYPINPYGRTKLMVENILEDYFNAYGLRSVCLRYFNAVGADSEADVGEWPGSSANLVPIALDVAIGRREKLTIFGIDYPTPDGTCLRDYIHVTDLAMAHIKALEYLNKENVAEVFNLGNGKGFSVKEVVAMTKQVTGIDYLVIEGEKRAGDPAILVADSKKAREVLNWNPEFNSLETIVKTAWVWHQKAVKMI